MKLKKLNESELSEINGGKNLLEYAAYALGYVVAALGDGYSKNSEENEWF